MRTRRAFRWAAAAAVLMAVAPSVAGADDKALREAQARFEEGLKRVKAGDFDGARMSFVSVRRPAQAGHPLEPGAEQGEERPRRRRPRPLQGAGDAVARRSGSHTHTKTRGRAEPPDRAYRGHRTSGHSALARRADNRRHGPARGRARRDAGHHVISGKLADGAKEMGVDAVAGEVRA